MLKSMVIGAVLAGTVGTAYLVVQSLPDIARYFEMREM
jgi:hypothetical protein